MCCFRFQAVHENWLRRELCCRVVVTEHGTAYCSAIIELFVSPQQLPSVEWFLREKAWRYLLRENKNRQRMRCAGRLVQNGA